MDETETKKCSEEKDINPTTEKAVGVSVEKTTGKTVNKGAKEAEKPHQLDACADGDKKLKDIESINASVAAIKGNVIDSDCNKESLTKKEGMEEIKESDDNKGKETKREEQNKGNVNEERKREDQHNEGSDKVDVTKPLKTVDKGESKENADTLRNKECAEKKDSTNKGCDEKEKQISKRDDKGDERKEPKNVSMKDNENSEKENENKNKDAEKGKEEKTATESKQREKNTEEKVNEDKSKDVKDNQGKDASKMKAGTLEKEMEPTEKKTESNEKKADPSEKKTELAEKKAEPTKKNTKPEKKAELTKKKMDPNEKKTEPTEKKTKPGEKKTEPGEKKIESTKKKAEATIKKTEPAENKTELEKKKAESSEKKMELAKKKIESTKEKEEPIKNKTDLTKGKTESAKKKAQSPEKKTEPAKAKTEPVEKKAEPIEKKTEAITKSEKPKEKINDTNSKASTESKAEVKETEGSKDTNDSESKKPVDAEVRKSRDLNGNRESDKLQKEEDPREDKSIDMEATKECGKKTEGPDKEKSKENKSKDTVADMTTKKTTESPKEEKSRESKPIETKASMESSKKTESPKAETKEDESKEINTDRDSREKTESSKENSKEIVTDKESKNTEDPSEKDTYKNELKVKDPEKKPVKAIISDKTKFEKDGINESKQHGINDFKKDSEAKPASEIKDDAIKKEEKDVISKSKQANDDSNKMIKEEKCKELEKKENEKVNKNANVKENVKNKENVKGKENVDKENVKDKENENQKENEVKIDSEKNINITIVNEKDVLKDNKEPSKVNTQMLKEANKKSPQEEKKKDVVEKKEDKESKQKKEKDENVDKDTINEKEKLLQNDIVPSEKDKDEVEENVDQDAAEDNTKESIPLNNKDADERRSTTKGGPPSRWIIAVLGCIGFMIVYGLKVNLSVAIIAMVNHTAVASKSAHHDDHAIVEEDGEDHSPIVLDTNNGSSSANECGVEEKKEDLMDGPFDWDENIQGLILASYFYGYIFTQVPGGWVAEKFSAKHVFGVGALANAILALLTPVAAQASYIWLIVIRVGMGIAGGVTLPGMHVLIANWAPPQERSKIASTIYAGMTLGTLVCMPFSGLLAATLDWTAIFYVQGGLSLIWYVLWLIFVYDSPAKHPRISQSERKYIEESMGTVTKAEKPPVPWKSVWTSMPVYAIIVAHTCSNWGWYMLLVKLPTYMRYILKFDIKANAGISAVPFLCMWIFTMLLANLLDALRAKKMITTTFARKLATFIASVPPAICLIGVTYVGCNTDLAVALLTLGTMFVGGMYSGFLSNHIDIAPPFAGTLMGISNTFATIPGIVVPSFVGYMTHGNQTVEAWRTIFFITLGIFSLEAVFFGIFGSGEEQPWVRPKPRNDPEEQRLNEGL